MRKSIGATLALYEYFMTGENAGDCGRMNA